VAADLPVHQAADRLEPQLAKAFLKSVADLQTSISINELAQVLASRFVKRADALLPQTAVTKSLERSAAVVREAVGAGGRIGAAQVVKAINGAT
jgi:hypothetical protein